ncbi:MAG: hypothetical protein K2H94_08730, partial [Duncaniella sp.]|nr:hypothetical protein [Duncaniella sp.]
MSVAHVGLAYRVEVEGEVIEIPAGNTGETLVLEFGILFCILSSVDADLDSLQLLAVINRAAMNIVEHVFLLNVGESSGYISR